MKKINLHSHTTYCDGRDKAESMVLAAIDAGFDIFGFSGHSYLDFDDSWCMSREGTLAYYNEIQDLKIKFKDDITILCGVEQDYFSGLASDKYDYVIGSVHVVYNKEYDKYISVDYTAENLIAAIDEYYGSDALSFAEEYYRMVGELPAITGCDIIGHFDLVTKFNEKAHIFDVTHPRYVAAVDDALEKLLATGMIFEVNTGAISRGYTSSPYPSESILRKIYEGGGRVIISSDTHSVSTVDCAYDQALMLIRECEFKSIAEIDENGEFFEKEIPI